MRRLQLTLGLALLFLIVACGPGGEAPETPPTDDRISEFGRYEGYSEARFDQWVRTSEYLTVRDGTRLAADVVRPAVDGTPVDEPLPVIWTHSRYHRTPDALVSLFDPDAEDDGTVISYVDADPGLQRLVSHGYVFVGVGVRGSGASYGTYEGLFSPAETRDAHDVIDWIVQQPWSDGNVGMWGGSYLGITQYMAASTGHPALKAIFPTVALFDFYEVAYPGGVFRDDMLEQWGELTLNLDTNVPAPPVDADPEGSERDAAVAEHADNWDVTEEIAAAPYRDHDSESFAWSRHSPARFLDEIDASGVAAYHFGGWYDVFALDEILWFVNYEGPDKLAMGPWSHTAQGEAWQQERARLEAVEQHRWFDRWLKDIDNGVMDGPPVHYATIDDAETWSWKSAPHWPPPETSVVTFHLSGGLTGSVDSVNDGLLTREDPSEAGFDEYEVDPSTTTGTASRWDNAVGQGPMSYTDMTSTEARSLTYTTPPLQVDVTLTGHPVVTLWATSSTGDADFHVLLEEVDAEGVSHYVTEGVLRASHRATSTPPWDNLGLPFQRSASGDPEPLPGLDGEPAEVVMDLIPTSRLFNAGHRIRLTVMGADADNTRPVEGTRAPTIRLYRGGDHPSRVELRLESGGS